MLRLTVAATLALILAMGKVGAHEFWISPEAYQIETGDRIEAALRVGEEFRGATQAYIPRNFTRFEVVTPDATRPVEGRIGDMPALSMEDMPEGLAIIVHETTARDLTWDEWERFVRFVEHKDLGDIAAMQAERGLDQVDATEDYIRYAKSLVAVGQGAGEDRVVGLRTELVALANPYTDDLAGVLPVQLWLDEAPRPNSQVELFARNVETGEVEITLHRTDSNGIVLLPVSRGHEYLVDAVTLEPRDPETGAEWRTLWASLTFAVPAPEGAPAP